MFKHKPEYFNIIIKSNNNKDIQLSLLKGKPIKEAIDEFNSHIQDKKKHIHKCRGAMRIIPKYNTLLTKEPFNKYNIQNSIFF